MPRCARPFVVLLLFASSCGDSGSGASALTAHRRALAVSSTHGCALRGADVYCWGENNLGQLGAEGVARADEALRAMDVGAGVVEVAVATGRSCVRRASGSVGCFGDNSRGQFGDGSRDGSARPVDALGIHDAAQLAVDENTTCVLHADGRVSCWGGAPARAPSDGSLTPVVIDGLHDIVELRGGVLDAYAARSSDGRVFAFRMQLGDWIEPIELPDLEGARMIAVTGVDEVCAIREDTSIACHNTVSGATIPLPESEASARIVGGSLVACAIDEGDVWRCWNILPPMLESTGTTAVEVPLEMPVHELAIAGFKACVVYEDESVGCANANDMPLTIAEVEGLP